MSTHIGIRLRIRTPAGVVLDADSDRMHFMASLAERDTCTPACLPDCGEHGWAEMFPGTGWEFNGHRDVVLEARPVMLPDHYYAGEDEDCSCPCSCHDHDCSDCSGCVS